MNKPSTTPRLPHWPSQWRRPNPLPLKSIIGKMYKISCSIHKVLNVCMSIFTAFSNWIHCKKQLLTWKRSGALSILFQGDGASPEHPRCFGVDFLTSG
jgi:hypothetical protein